jgi:PAS domain S-box-containing protein
MDREIRVLLLEDNASDAELVMRELRKAGLSFRAEWAPDKASFLRTLDSFQPDIVLADYLLPGFDGLAALALVRERSAEVPVIVVSGAVGEEVAIETLKAGATDYVLKDRLSRLGPVVRRALQEAEQLARRKRAEDALRDHERELQLILDGGPTLIAYVDVDVRYRWANKTYNRWLGHAKENMSERHVREMVGEAAWQRIGPYVERALAGETVAYEQELSLPTGTSRWVYASYTPDRDESGRVRGFVVHAVDITERKRAEAALHELTKTLEAKVAQRTQELEHRARQLQKLTLELSQAEDRERKRLAEILHDDLQQQLAAAKFHLGLLASRARGNDSVQKAAGQIGDMLMQAIQTSRSLSHELSPVMLNHGDLGETLEWLAGQIRAKHGLDVQVRTDGAVDSPSDALKAFVYRAAQELLFNIVKHARVDRAQTRLRQTGRCLCLTVSDRGRGFDPRDLKATTGFGLLGIRERVQSLGGRMRIRSAPGKGSTFFLAVSDGTEEGKKTGG